MSKNKKFTEDELAKIVELREANALKITEFGQVELEILLANQRIEALKDAKNKLQEDYVGLQDKEQDLIKELNIPDHKIWAMPAGDDRESLFESYGPVMNFVRDRGW